MISALEKAMNPTLYANKRVSGERWINEMNDGNCRCRNSRSLLLQILTTAQSDPPGMQLATNATRVIDVCLRPDKLGNLFALETVAVNRCSITGDVSMFPIGVFSCARWQFCATACTLVGGICSLNVAFVACHGQSCHEAPVTAAWLQPKEGTPVCMLLVPAK